MPLFWSSAAKCEVLFNPFRFHVSYDYIIYVLTYSSHKGDCMLDRTFAADEAVGIHRPNIRATLEAAVKPSPHLYGTKLCL